MSWFFPSVLILFGLVVARMDRYFFKANDSFSEKRIFFKEKNPTDWQVPFLSEEKNRQIDQILSQPFFYLTKGQQSFVFLSADKRYVLKFCRIPSHSCSLKKIYPTVLSFTNAFCDLGRETRVICANFPINREVLLIDKLKAHYRVNLMHIPWVLQEFGQRFFLLFDSLVNQEAIAREIVTKTIALYKSCWKKDYIDRDVIPDKNFGLLNHEPMILDIGRLEKGAQKMSLRNYLFSMTESLGRKLQRESPSLYAHYLQCID